MTLDARSTFAHFIGAAGPGRAARDVAAAAGPEAIAHAKERWSGQVIGPTVSRARVETLLGAPDISDAVSLGYQLPGFPHHVFTFEFDDRGVQLRAGFRRRGNSVGVPLPAESGSSRNQYLRSLAALGTTEDELVARFGEPIERDGWWPCETLRFEGGLEIELRLGVVLAD